MIRKAAIATAATLSASRVKMRRLNVPDSLS